jgi:hypothetical protein
MMFRIAVSSGEAWELAATVTKRAKASTEKYSIATSRHRCASSKLANGARAQGVENKNTLALYALEPEQ